MLNNKFISSVKYGDLKGKSAADRHDKAGAEQWLTERGLREKKEHILGIKATLPENHDRQVSIIHVQFLLVDFEKYKNIHVAIENVKKPIEVRSVDVDMNVTEYFGLFKRFSVTLSPDGIMTDKAYKIID